MAEPNPGTESGTGNLRPVLGPFSATCIVIGAIIGIGIFFTPSTVARLTGSQEVAMWTWALGGLIAMAGALTFAELGGMYPRTGAQYEILRDAWSAPVAFSYVFCNATLIQAGAIAIIAWHTAANLGVVVLGKQPETAGILVSASAMIVVLTLTNVFGVRYGSAVQNGTVICKVLTLLLIGTVALFVPPAEPASGLAEPGASAAGPSSTPVVLLIFAGLVPVFFSLGGWQHALWIGGEVRDSKRTIPIAIISGVAIVTVVYLIANWAYFRLLGFEGVRQSETLAADAAGSVWPGIGSRLVAGAIAISAAGVLNAQLLSGPRLLYGMARDGRFFAPFAHVSARSRTPYFSIFFLGGLGLTMLLCFADADRIDRLLTSVVLIDCLFFALTGMALFRLRPRHRHEDSWRALWYPLFPAIFVSGELLILVLAATNPRLLSGIWLVIAGLALSLICYFLFFSKSIQRPASQG